VGTYDGNNVKIYVDGIQRGESEYSNSITYSTNPIALGKYYAYGPTTYNFS
jgi:hypothetical protein